MTPRSLRPLGAARRGLVSAGLLAAALLAAPNSWTEPVLGQTFRSSVDLIAVDVQVLDRAGEAVTSLRPDQFEVTLDGRRRRVVSVDLARYDISPLPSEEITRTIPAAIMAEADDGALLTDRGGRTFIVAIDTGSFRNFEIRPALMAADRFTRRLLPEDTVGVVVLPDGPTLLPTMSHASARQLVSTVIGRKVMNTNQLEMDIEQVIDITAAASNQSYLQARRAVGRMIDNPNAVPEDITVDNTLECSGPLVACTEAAITEAQALAAIFEEDVLRGLSGLDALLRQLQDSPGRKTVLLLSGGMPVSDRSGGRPALPEVVKQLGEQATYANATIHTLYFDPGLMSGYGSDVRARPRPSSNRVDVINTRALAEFSEPSGGTLTRVSTGAGEVEIDRLVAQTSTYYILGVEPDARDRDGRAHRLRVRVNERNVSVRSRQLVVVPRAGS